MDDLLSDDDMKLYAQKSEILDTPLSKKIQILLMGLAFLCALLHSIYFLSNTFIQGMLNYSSHEVTIKTVLLTLLLGYGVYGAVSDRLSPKLTMFLYIYYLASNLVVTIIGMIGGLAFSMPAYIAAILYDIVFIAISIRFFSGGSRRSPILLYIMIAIELIAGINGFLLNVLNAPYDLFRDIFMMSLLSLMQGIFFYILLVFMTYTLDKKRKRAAR